MGTDTYLWFNKKDLINKSERAEIQGRGVQVSPSPYDIPEALGGTLDKERNLLTLVVKYISPDEPYRTSTVDGVLVRVGKNSNRLYSMTFDRDSTGSKELVGTIHKVLASLVRDPLYSKAKVNYGLIEKAVTLQEPQVRDFVFSMAGTKRKSKSKGEQPSLQVNAR